MECLKYGLYFFLQRRIQTSVVNSHTVTHKPIAPAGNPAQLKFNCSGSSDYYIDLNFVRLLLRMKLVKTDVSYIESAEPNRVVNNLYSMFSSLGVSLNGKPVTLHEINYHYKAYLERLLNYGSDSSGTHLVSSFLYLDSPGELKDDSGYARRLNYLCNSKIPEIYGRLHADLFNSDKFLINDVDVNIKLTRAPEAFYFCPISAYHGRGRYSFYHSV